MECKNCNIPMVVKEGKYGKFFGCTNFPMCREIVKIEGTTGTQNNGQVTAKPSWKPTSGLDSKQNSIEAQCAMKEANAAFIAGKIEKEGIYEHAKGLYNMTKELQNER
jgi:ssDNA-binding Zn-finger/Zn-ribbon topoisomerase 1